MLRFLLFVAFVSANDRIAVSFTLEPLNSSDLSPLMFEIFIPSGNGNDYADGVAFAPKGSKVLRGMASFKVNQNKPTYEFGMKMVRFVGKKEVLFTQWSHALWVKSGKKSHVYIKTEEYIMDVNITAYDFKKVEAKVGLIDCDCQEKNCFCCVNVDIPEPVEFHHQVCTNVSYNPESIGLDLSVGLDGYYYTWEVSARNPPPICFDIPGIEEVAAGCIRFEKLDVSKEHIAGCMEIELELIHMRIAHAPIGCFDMPI